jgi:nuclear GTP-binding protein
MRSKATIMRLNTAKGGKAIRNKEGTVIGGTLLMNNTAGGQKITGQARIAPDRRWFGNTRVIAQTELDNLREKVNAQSSDPYTFVMRRKKVPMALLQESQKVAKLNILENESFEDVFGTKQNRKRPKLDNSITDYASLMEKVEKQQANLSERDTRDSTNIYFDDDGRVDEGKDISGAKDLVKDDLFAKGQSKRIWGELYKVLDCSDVIIEVVDARNIPGTRCHHIENHIKKHASHKQLIIVINKCDLIPSWAARKWIKQMSKEFPTLAFHASISHSFGKGALISLLRQFAKLHNDKRQISVGIIGYPNTGKSSIINTLKGTKCCKTAPIPGETKVWQYVTLTKKIYLIDSPGVVYDGANDDETETVLKGVVRSERLKDPTDFVAPMLARLTKEHVKRVYGISDWENDEDFMTQLAKTKGKLLPSGEADMATVAKMMINDWQRGKLPYFVPPPREEKEGEEAEEENDQNDEQEFPESFEHSEDDEEEDGEGDDDNNSEPEDDDEEEDDEEEQ